MRPDVSELSQFYAGDLGAVARRLIMHRLRTMWPSVRGEIMLGIGYAAPFMRQFRQEAARQILCMPEDQGAVRWPGEGPSGTFLASETALPLKSSSVDRVLAVHCLEHSVAIRHILREVWRVLSPEGRLMLVVPNRRGMWARADSTPFGHGRPYSKGQLERQLDDCLFAPTGWGASLFMPPMSRQVILNTAIAWERIGLYAWPHFSGVLIVEAEKQVYAPIMGKRVPVRARLRPIRAGLAASRGLRLPEKPQAA
ncbi:MAG: class I SAM-dependent methyltransferase [Hyphomicrobiales bacterium]|nr:class I SAM-dependent methyltransferase [Hyphomicrobiales bacterium]